MKYENIRTNMSLDEFRSLPEESKFEKYLVEGKLFDLIFAEQFSRSHLDDLFILTNKIRLISKTNVGMKWLNSLLSTQKVMLYFLQPSTRTFLSFQTACETLGMKVADVREASTTSEVKGESYADTIRTFSSYFDLVIIRHPAEGGAEEAAWILNQTRRPLPVINAGSGADEHPTQALLDIFTLRKSFSKIGGLDGKTVMMSGDLKRGRTVRSLSKILTRFHNVKMIFSSPQEFSIENDILEYLNKRNVEYDVTTEFNSCVKKADAVYMTRIQDEWDNQGESKNVDTSRYHFTEKHLDLLKSSAIVMHPLPRRQEIATSVDEDPRAMYWRQVRNGMWVRVALIAYIFGLKDKILAH